MKSASEISFLSDLKMGESGTILSFIDHKIGLKMMEMGFLPGEKVTVQSQAPLGCPVNISSGKQTLSLRKSEAATIKITKNG